MGLDIRIDIEDASGNRLGDGPITSAASWKSTLRMDKAGSFEFTMPASDAKAAQIVRKRIARGYAFMNGAWVEIGAGIIDRIRRQVQPNGEVTLSVSGDDLTRELSYRSVLDLRLYDNGLPVTQAQAIAAVAGYAPAGWTFTPDPSPPSTVYGYFNGDTVLAGMVKVADKSRSHFYRGDGRRLIFASSFADSGIRCVEASADLPPEACAIVGLSEQVDVYDLLTRIYPRGSGNADVQLTLRATTRTAPAGYILNAAQNYIEHTATTAEFGRIERQLNYREIGPVANTDADIRSAANALFDAAYEELRRAVSLQASTYTLQLAGCPVLLRPMQTVRVVYRDLVSAVDIDATLNILESTIQVDRSGVQTTGLRVSTGERWAADDTTTIASSIMQGRVYQALPQLSANSYVTAYSKNVDADNTALFRFRFGREVTQLQQVQFEFQLLPFESTVKGVGLTSTTGGSGTLETDGPNINASGAPSNDTSGAASGDTGAATGNTGAAAGSTAGPSTDTSGAPSNNTSGAPSNNTSGTATGNTGAASGDTGSAGGGNTGNGGAGNTSNGGGGNTGSPTGGDTVSAGRHSHRVDVSPSGSGGVPVYFKANGSNSDFYTVGSSGGVPVTVSGDHVHSMTNHTHPISDHVHAVGAHTHTLNSHAHTLNNHTHDLNGHTHTLNSHTHTLGNHTHTLNNHTHGMNAHVHNLGAHTHSLNAHTHSLSNHKHTFTPVVDMVYGIFRDVAASSVERLQYRVNGGPWSSLMDAVPAAGGWWLLDITSALIDPDTFRPLRPDNFLEIGVSAEPSSIILGPYAADITTELFTANRVASGYIFDVGDIVLADVSGTILDGLWQVTACTDTTITLKVYKRAWPTDITYYGIGGTLTGPVGKRVTVDAQLSVRNTIQAIAYVS